MGHWLERYRGILFFVVVILALAGVVFVQVLKPKPAPIFLTTSTPSPLPEATPTPCPLRVYVSGAVNQPDVYVLPPDSIVKDALLAAGGPTDAADLDRINLALPVADGQHIYVPYMGEENPPVEPPSEQPSSGGSASDEKVNINTADQATLETLPGVGPSLAQRIIEYRQIHGPFERIEDVMNVSGIGPATFAKIQNLIKIR
jgi:competence protein ComEA